MEYKDIHKEIYNYPDIRKGFKNIWTSWLLTGIGVVCGFLYFRFPCISSGLSTWLLGLMSTGIFCLALILCFYTFGDRRFPYYKKGNKMLEPTQVYYSCNVREQLEEALEHKDEKALEAVNKSTLPDIVLERFSDKDEHILYSQLMELRSGKLVPVSDIYINIVKE